MGKVNIKKPQEIKKMRQVGEILGIIMQRLAQEVKNGSIPSQIDSLARKLAREFEVNTSCLGYQGYTAAVCIGRNDQAVHCIPDNKPFENGDIVTVDMVIDQDGWFADHAVTVGVGDIDKKAQELINLTEDAMYNAIDKAITGNTIGDLGYEMESTVKKNGFNVLRSMIGHGIGRSMHEEPSVPCFGKKGEGLELAPGMVITIEPMVVEGSPELSISEDKWSTRTKDGSRFAMFEHTVAITENGVEILTKIE